MSEELRVFQDKPWKRNMVKDIDEIFKRDMRKTQDSREMEIPAVVKIEDYLSLRRSIMRGSMAEVLKMGLDEKYCKRTTVGEKGEMVTGDNQVWLCWQHINKWRIGWD